MQVIQMILKKIKSKKVKQNSNSKAKKITQLLAANKQIYISPLKAN